jgi:hypothetical protein
MKGYEIVTAEDESVGHVVVQEGDYLILQHGLFHTRHALPLEFVHVDHDTKQARTTLSRELIEGSPKLEHDEGVDVQAVADYYGLSDTTVPDDQLGAVAEEAAAEQEDEAVGRRSAPLGRPVIPPDSHT